MREVNRFVISIFALIYTSILIAQNCANVDIKSNIEFILPRCNSNNGAIVVSDVEGGVPPYSYTINDTLTTSVGGFFNLQLGSYTIITSDARGCRDTSSVELRYKELENFIRPDNAFTPNDDGIHDTWRIPGVQTFQQISVKVFNRWGQEVHSNEPYDNRQAWDGKQNGVKVPEGTYYYVISVSDPCIEDYLKGSVTVIR